MNTCLQLHDNLYTKNGRQQSEQAIFPSDITIYKIIWHDVFLIMYGSFENLSNVCTYSKVFSILNILCLRFRKFESLGCLA